MDRKTLGGSKKLTFAPKKIIQEDIPDVEIQPTIIEPKKQIAKPKHARPFKNMRPEFEVFTANKQADFRDKTTVDMTFGGEAQTADLMFKEEHEPQALVNENIANCYFGDDILYLFNGIERSKNSKIKFYEDGRVVFIIDDKSFRMSNREIDKMDAVLIDDNIKEIGSVFYSYSVCRDDI